MCTCWLSVPVSPGRRHSLTFETPAARCALREVRPPGGTHIHSHPGMTKPPSVPSFTHHPGTSHIYKYLEGRWDSNKRYTQRNGIFFTLPSKEQFQNSVRKLAWKKKWLREADMDGWDWYMWDYKAIYTPDETIKKLRGEEKENRGQAIAIYWCGCGGMQLGTSNSLKSPTLTASLVCRSRWKLLAHVWVNFPTWQLRYKQTFTVGTWLNLAWWSLEDKKQE